MTKLFHSRIGNSPSRYKKVFGNKTYLFGESESRLFYKILDYVYKNSADDISVNTVAQKFGINNSKLNELFIFHVEKSFLNFVNFVRVNNSCVLLLETDKNITDIAFEVGYNNTKTFLRNFIKYRQVSPSEFRKKCNLQNFDL